MQIWMATDLTEETECRVEMSGTQTHDRKQEPDQVNAATDIPGIVTEETDEDGGEDEKDDVTDLRDDRHFIRKGQRHVTWTHSIRELGYVRVQFVVTLAPVHSRSPTFEHSVQRGKVHPVLRQSDRDLFLG